MRLLCVPCSGVSARTTLPAAVIDGSYPQILNPAICPANANVPVEARPKLLRYLRQQCATAFVENDCI